MSATAVESQPRECWVSSHSGVLTWVEREYPTGGIVLFCGSERGISFCVVVLLMIPSG